MGLIWRLLSQNPILLSMLCFYLEGKILFNALGLAFIVWFDSKDWPIFTPHKKKKYDLL